MSSACFGLLGEKLGHSYSPLIHRLFGLPDYQLFSVAPAQLESFLHSNAFAGLNVTTPYKRAVVPYCNELSPIARRLGNVNTITFNADGGIYGDNTDYQGFCYLLKQAGIDLQGKKVLILGAGGAAQTAALAAADQNASSVVQLSRDNVNNLAQHADAQILINATPLGMYPHNNELAANLDVFPALTGVVDLVYNPLRTWLILAAEERGIAASGGLMMLVEQARLASSIFQKRQIEQIESKRVYRRLLQRRENIVLIGMPGSGKSVIAKAVAGKMGRKLIDTDKLIFARTGRWPAEIIVQDGEPFFRRVEAQIINDCAKDNAAVIASGGGAILMEENALALRQNSRVYWLKKPLERLKVKGRPLSTDLAALYAVREPLYAAAADISIDASGDIAQIAETIVEEFYEYTGA